MRVRVRGDSIRVRGDYRESPLQIEYGNANAGTGHPAMAGAPLRRIQFILTPHLGIFFDVFSNAIPFIVIADDMLVIIPVPY